MEKELKRTKRIAGITLIALVITIVVLIILAGVLINISLGNNGLFNKAKTAKEMYVNSQEYEETEIAKITNNIDSYVDGNRNNYNELLTRLETLETQHETLKTLVNNLFTSSTSNNFKKIVGTLPSSANTWEKIANYPEGYNYTNTYVISAFAYNLDSATTAYIIPNNDNSNYVHLYRGSDGIYAKCNSFFISYKVDLLIIKVD